MIDLKKKVIIIGIIFIILVLVGITGVYKKNKNRIYHITITEKFWDQYGKQYHNEELKEKIKFNDQIKVNGGLGDELTFRVIKVNNDSITIKTSEKMSQIKIDLLSTDDEFVIKKGEETVINRLVMDGGVSYTIKLER